VNWHKTCQEHRNSYKGAKKAKNAGRLKSQRKTKETQAEQNRAAKENSTRERPKH
jgi:hypothetical protein